MHLSACAGPARNCQNRLQGQIQRILRHLLYSRVCAQQLKELHLTLFKTRSNLQMEQLRGSHQQQFSHWLQIVRVWRFSVVKSTLAPYQPPIPQTGFPPARFVVSLTWKAGYDFRVRKMADGLTYNDPTISMSLSNIVHSSSSLLVAFHCYFGRTQPYRSLNMVGRQFLRLADSAFSLLNVLSQWQTNGGSILGTSQAPTLKPYLGETSSWGHRTVAASHVINDMPVTGKNDYLDSAI